MAKLKIELKTKYIFYTIILIIGLILPYMIFHYAPIESKTGDLYRIFYLHVSTAWISYFAFGVTMIGSILYLFRRDYLWDSIAAISAQLGVIFCSTTLIIGSIWAGAAWGIYWNWDPRETTTLILWILYVSYLSFRMSIHEKEKRARISAVLGILAFISVPLSYFSVKLWFSIHSLVIEPGRIGLTAPMIHTLIIAMVAILLIYLVLLKLTLDIYNLEEEILILKEKMR
ncbi:cytochrome c biogenesis protein [[Eubacterium] cellulosolvens]